MVKGGKADNVFLKWKRKNCPAERSRSRESTEEACRGGTLDWYAKRSRSRESTEEGARGGTLDWLELISCVSGSRGGCCTIQSESG